MLVARLIAGIDLSNNIRNVFLRRGVELLPSGKWGVKHDPLTHKALKIAGFAVVPPPPTLVPGVVPGSA